MRWARLSGTGLPEAHTGARYTERRGDVSLRQPERFTKLATSWRRGKRGAAALGFYALDESSDRIVHVDVKVANLIYGIYLLF